MDGWMDGWMDRQIDIAQQFLYLETKQIHSPLRSLSLTDLSSGTTMEPIAPTPPTTTKGRAGNLTTEK